MQLRVILEPEFLDIVGLPGKLPQRARKHRSQCERNRQYSHHEGDGDDEQLAPVLFDLGIEFIDRRKQAEAQIGGAGQCDRTERGCIGPAVAVIEELLRHAALPPGSDRGGYADGIDGTEARQFARLAAAVRRFHQVSHIRMHKHAARIVKQKGETGFADLLLAQHGFGFAEQYIPRYHAVTVAADRHADRIAGLSGGEEHVGLGEQAGVGLVGILNHGLSRGSKSMRPGSWEMDASVSDKNGWKKWISRHPRLSR